MADVDVLVVGSGAAGLAAALSAREAGAERVMVAEGERAVGGSSRLSGGIIMGAGTRYQRALGIDDDADALFHDYMTLNQWQVETAVVRRLCELAGPSVEWLGDLGVRYHEQLIFGGDERVPRCHCPIGRGAEMVEVLERHCKRHDVEFALGNRVDRLLVEGGRVAGVAVGDDELSAGAVIVTAGGFGNNPEKLAKFFPAAADCGDSVWYIGADGARGDHLDLADQVGAQLAGFNRGLRLLHPGFVPILEAYLPGWMVLVNRDGRRFGDETAPYGIMDGLVAAQGDQVWAIFDHAAISAATVDEAAEYKQSIPSSSKRQSPNWNDVTVAEMAAKGKVAVADTVESLGLALGLPPATLAGTVARYNAGAAAGEDPDYAKKASFVRALSTPPFYGAELRPATVCFTSTGMRIDRDARVLDLHGAVIPGLYAAGESAGGVIGPRYVGSGNSYASCVVFGRVAGAHAAGYVKVGPGRAS